MKYTIELFPFRVHSDHCRGCNVMVRMENGQTYFGSLYTFEEVSRIHRESRKNGEYMDGSYFWNSNMIIMEKIDHESTRKIIEEMIRQDTFYNAFFPANREAMDFLVRQVS